jgi:hypothetical protein
MKLASVCDHTAVLPSGMTAESPELGAAPPSQFVPSLQATVSPPPFQVLSAANAGSASSSDYHAAVSAPAAPRMQQAPSYAPADSGFTQVDDDELPF